MIACSVFVAITQTQSDRIGEKEKTGVTMMSALALNSMHIKNKKQLGVTGWLFFQKWGRLA